MTYKSLDKQKPLRVSVVLPVYNEAAHLAACLRALAAQTVAPYEVIVVDNNSTDVSPEIAREFPFVRLVAEHRQGVVHARNRGFNVACGDIIGRIDADTVVSETWVADVQRIFATSDTDAVTGKMRYYDVANSAMLDAIDLFFRRHFARVLGREVALQGANMALRRSAWQEVRKLVCSKGGMHEDFDLAIHLNQAGYNVRFDESLVASIGYRQAGCSWRSFVTYAALSPVTYGKHGLKSKRYMYKVVILVAVFYPILRLMYRGYDPSKQRFSWRKLRAGGVAVRVNPALFTD